MAIAAMAGALVWSGDSGYRISTLTLMIAYALIALGMYMPVAWASSLSLAYGAYAATGAYVVAYLSLEHGVPLGLGWVVGALAACAMSVLVGAVTTRLTGFHLAAVTLLFTVAFETWLRSEPALGSSNGLSGLPPASIFGWDLGPRGVAILGMVLVLAVAIAIDRLRDSSWGVIARSAGDVPHVVASSGASVPKFSLVLLGVGAAISALAGSFFVTANSGITPETFSLHVVFLALFMPLIGGIDSPWGAVVGAVLTVLLTVYWTVFEAGGGLLVLSAAVLLVLLLAPRGILGGLAGAWSLVARTKSGGRA